MTTESVMLTEFWVSWHFSQPDAGVQGSSCAFVLRVGGTLHSLLQGLLGLYELSRTVVKASKV